MTFGNPIRKSPMKCPRSVWNVVPNASITPNSRKEKGKPCYVEMLQPIGIAVGIFIPHLGSRKNCLFSSVLHLLKAKVSKRFQTNEINKLSDMNHMNEIKWNEEWGNEKKDEVFSQNHGYFWLSIASSCCQREGQAGIWSVRWWMIWYYHSWWGQLLEEWIHNSSWSYV